MIKEIYFMPKVQQYYMYGEIIVNLKKNVKGRFIRHLLIM